ncbi:MAG: hypothetical protein JWM59_3918 [Verrucomicrobiales bacterium]|nr:hypothetical protein [Verrucomicrobiales bacterium]
MSTTKVKLLALVLTALSSAAANAASYTSGDLLLGFVAGSGVGSNETLVINLGSAAVFRDGFDSGTVQINFENIGTELTTQFGSGGTPWYERTDLYISLFGSTGSDTIGDTLINGDPFRTVYASRSRQSEDAIPSLFTINSNTAITTTSGQIVSTSGVFAGSASNANGVSIIPDAANTLDKFTKPLASNSFTNLSGGIEQAFGTGAWGSFSATGPVEAALDLQRIQAVNNIPGQYGEGALNRRGDFTGTFTINNGGDISFIPEPSTSGILLLTGLSSLLRRRRA